MLSGEGEGAVVPTGEHLGEDPNTANIISNQCISGP